MSASTSDFISEPVLFALPDAVLEVIFSLCACQETIRVISLVCQHWRSVFQHSSIALPLIKLSGPLPDTWLSSHAGQVRKLNIRRCDSIVALASCSNLQRLHLEDCRKVSDLSPLTDLSHLHTLLLRNLRHLVDLQPVAELPVLSTLGLDRCFARDLGPLCAATRLENLYLSYDCWAIVGVTFPSRLPALNKLRLMAAVQDLTPLASYTSLTSLEVYAVSVYDLGPLSHLTRLQELDLHQLQVEQGWLDMSPLSTLVNLTSLGLQGSDDDIVQGTAWPRLTALCKLDLHGSRVSDLQPIRVLTGLKSLELSQTRGLHDVGHLSVLTGLQELVLTGSKNVRDLRPVLQLTGLRRGVGVLRKP